MSVKPTKKLVDLISDFDAAMLVTRSPAGDLYSRPMVVADVESDGDLWFVTDRDSGKMDDIEADPHVNVTMQSRGKFVSLSGRATAVDDRDKVEQLWNEAWKVWFPKGKIDPALVLLRVDARDGEYWDRGGLNAVRYIVEAGRAYLAGERPEVDDPAQHSRVQL